MQRARAVWDQTDEDIEPQSSLSSLSRCFLIIEPIDQPCDECGEPTQDRQEYDNEMGLHGFVSPNDLVSDKISSATYMPLNSHSPNPLKS